VIGVVRSFPIRVAGNSGDLPFETTFAAIGLPEERTTVTNKVRRIGRFDPLAFRRACLLNGPTSLALTFTDYLPVGSVPAWKRLVEDISAARVDYLGVADVMDSWTAPDSLLHLAHQRWASTADTA
jgi:adenylosuccinate synthase